jgi:molybdate transport system substrate-binding protein
LAGKLEVVRRLLTEHSLIIKSASVVTLFGIGCIASTIARAEEVKIYSAAAVRSAVARVSDRFSTNGDHADFIFGTAGSSFDKVARGAPFDLVIVPPPQLAELSKRGLIVDGIGGPLGIVRLGLAVRSGSTGPSLTDVSAFKAALLAAPSIGVADPAAGATTGIYLSKLFTKLGILDSIKNRLRHFPDGNAAMEAVARGEVAIAAGQISEIRPVAGVDLVGPLPEAIQLKTTYSVGLASNPIAPQAAHKLLEALTSAQTKAEFLASGFDIP